LLLAETKRRVPYAVCRERNKDALCLAPECFAHREPCALSKNKRKTVNSL